MKEEILLKSLDKWEKIVVHMEEQQISKTSKCDWVSLYWARCSYCLFFSCALNNNQRRSLCPLNETVEDDKDDISICHHAFTSLTIADTNIMGEALRHARIVVEAIKKDCEKRKLI